MVGWRAHPAISVGEGGRVTVRARLACVVHLGAADQWDLVSFESVRAGRLRVSRLGHCVGFGHQMWFRDGSGCGTLGGLSFVGGTELESEDSTTRRADCCPRK